MATLLEKVRSIANEYGIPEYVWLPILMSESGGNPNARALSTTEDSRGLFQINSAVHPQYANNNLYDPEVNARIAFSDFINPVWQTVKDDNSMTAADKTAYVWKNGIRPKWTNEKDAAIRGKVAEVMNPTPESKKTGLWAKIVAFMDKNYAPDVLSITNTTTGQTVTGGSSSAQATAGGAVTVVPDGDKFTILKDSWFTPEISFSRDKIKGTMISILLMGLGIILLVIVLKSAFLGGASSVVSKVIEGSKAE